jgi:hypothetical protein
MKTFIYSSVLVLLAIVSLPTTSEAFSRRQSGSEIGLTQAVTSNTITTNNVSAQAVPEPPVLLLMSIGLGVFALVSAIKKYQKPS